MICFTGVDKQFVCFNHSSNLASSLLITLAKSSTLLLKQNMFVSSAKSLGLASFMAFAMSFTNIVKRIGPRTEPCGTPVVHCS